jgi:serine/threonine protein kinase
VPWSALTLQQRLGEGASGVTWQALWQPAAGPARAVAVKLFRGAITSDGLSDSEQAASLSVGPHPQLCSAWARLTGHPHGTAGLVMPLLDARLQPLAGPPSLDSCSRDVYASDARFSATQATRLLQDAAQALAHLHDHGVLHGDFYAHNLLWHPTSGAAVLSDLGAALRWPDSAGFAWPSAQRWDVLAFGHLVAEVLVRLAPSEEAQALRRRWLPWQVACQSSQGAERPTMREVAHAVM